MAKHDISRRSVLSSTALFGTWFALEPIAKAEAHVYSREQPWTEEHEDPPHGASPGPYQFFTADEAAFVDAAVARMIPNDDLGPGAKEAGVTTFLDRQLVGPYGRAQTWYMQGPWEKGEKTQGYQYRLTPAQLYRTAIKAIDDHCRETFGGKAFRDLSIDQQDDLLQKIDKEDMKLQNISGMSFMTFFMRNVVEGFFSDPIYGGNRDMVGWKMIGFPGAHYDYRDYVSKHNQDLKIKPVGLKGRPDWKP
ncbi:MAG TPA: gluconate 2-dehydrogenase subunit 3 family protein [Alphaproteobacteria bacterium]|jgi:gluconate 2-dehydrogenase gamma chain|nr:gluconate 2-dehydrogenase subunit 3 family protein [Alphaproteobacteria bacterium]